MTTFMTLDQLGLKHGTDKASGSHNYLQWYEGFLAPLRKQHFQFIEMGVGSGGSLATWRDYFPYAHIVGMDIESDKVQYEDGLRVNVVVGDQSIDGDLDRVLGEAPSPMVINDDAGHQPEHQMFAYKYLLPHLAPGGLYFLEDIGGENVTEFLCQLAKRCVHGNWQDDNDEWIRNHGSRIESIAFYRETSATRMKP
jgi:trans-aconitate methyltransferase